MHRKADKRPCKKSGYVNKQGCSPPASPESKLPRQSPLLPANSTNIQSSNIAPDTLKVKADFRENGSNNKGDDGKTKLHVLTSGSDENNPGLSQRGSRVKRTMTNFKNKMLLKSRSSQHARWMSRLENAIVTNNCTDVTRLLANNNGDICEFRFTDGDTLLHKAINLPCVNCVKSLLNYQATAIVNVQNDCGITPLMLACERNLLDICQLLVTYNANVEVRSVLGETALHIATRAGQYSKYECLNYLIECGADINAQTDAGVTALHSLVFQNRTHDRLQPLVNLIQQGARTDTAANFPNILQGKPVTAFELAFLLNNFEAIVTFTEAGHEIPIMRLTEGSRIQDSALMSKVIDDYISERRSSLSLKVSCRNCINNTLNKLSRRISAEQAGLPKVLVSYLKYDQLYEICSETIETLFKTEDLQMNIPP